MTFPCTGCGSCCKRIRTAVHNTNVVDNQDPLFFPYTWDNDGVCENLTIDNKCKVYSNRPLICNIEKYAEYLKLNKYDFYKLNIQACNYLMDLDGVHSSFRIK